MDELTRFLALYRSELIARLECIRALLHGGGNSSLKFVDQVLDTCSRMERDIRCALPCRLERRFWYALYTYEDAGDASPAGLSGHFLDLQQLQLHDALRLLRANQLLPPGYRATRPDELEFLEGFERMWVMPHVP